MTGRGLEAASSWVMICQNSRNDMPPVCTLTVGKLHLRIKLEANSELWSMIYTLKCLGEATDVCNLLRGTFKNKIDGWVDGHTDRKSKKQVQKVLR